MMKPLLLLTLFTYFSASAQEPTVTEASAAIITEDPSIPDDGTRVSILGYHDLSSTLPETEMRIDTAKFRKQMESIRQMGIKVISMEEFTAWKKGLGKIPLNSIVITFDDGWKTVYTDAYPVLKELGYPFTLFLYKNYVDGGGKALTTAMIEEMMNHGANLGSHSISHPYPLTIKSYRKKGLDAYDAYLRKEIGESKRFLESKFPCKINTYAYPGGYFTEEMTTLGMEFGYDFMFTVIPGKVKKSLLNDRLPRYIILGTHEKIFNLATTFQESSLTSSHDTSPSLTHTEISTYPPPLPTTPYPVTPEAGAIVNSRLPLISADLSKLENFDPTTLTMKISGFGEVPAIFSPETKAYAWQVNRRLRQTNTQVAITWKDSSGKIVTPSLRWSFQIDLDAAYLPEAP